MPELEPPDTHHYSSAAGWLELGSPDDAFCELKKISPQARLTKAVLNLEWSILAALKDWDASLTPARSLVERWPEHPAGWIHLAYTQRRMASGGLEAAWETLAPAAEKFPEEPIIAYNLACYATQFGRIDEAWSWLQKAVRISGDPRDIKPMALADPDLEPLWPKIQASL